LPVNVEQDRGLEKGHGRLGRGRGRLRDRGGMTQENVGLETQRESGGQEKGPGNERLETSRKIVGRVMYPWIWI